MLLASVSCSNVCAKFRENEASLAVLPDLLLEIDSMSEVSLKRFILPFISLLIDQRIEMRNSML